MLDVQELEEEFHASLVIQFTFICFFSPFLASAGLISFLINLAVIVFTIKIYTQVSRRPIPRRVSDLGIWKDFYKVIGFLGVLFNSILIAKHNDGIRAITEFRFRNQPRSGSVTTSDIEIIYRIQFILIIAKIFLDLLIPGLPDWIVKKRVAEARTKDRAFKDAKIAAAEKRTSKSKNNNKKKENVNPMEYFYENKSPVPAINKVLFEEHEKEWGLETIHIDKSTMK